MSATITIELEVPKSRATCATWILEQCPEKCADALELCESACRALHSQISSGEVQRHAMHVQRLEKELAEQRHNVNAAVTMERERIEAKGKQIQDQLVKSLQEKHDSHMQITKKTLEDTNMGMKRELDILRDRLNSSEDEKRKLLAEMQSKIDSAVKSELERSRDVLCAEFDSRRQIDLNTIESLSAENEQMKYKIASSKSEYADRAELLCQQNRCTLQAKDESIRSIQQQHEARTTELIKELTQAKADTKEWQQIAWDTRKEKENALEEYKNEMIKLHLKTREFLATLSGSDSKGEMGESIAHHVFADLELGVLEVPGKNPSPGVADGLWKLDFDGDVPGIRALVEIKNCKKLHSKNDIAKFNTDVRAAVSQNRINCALLISERCRIEGTKKIDIRIENGILVVRASRAADDDLSVASLVKFVFVSVAQAWPHLSMHTQTNKDAVVGDIAAFLSTLLVQISSLDPRIKFLRDTGNKMLREAVQLDELQHKIVHGIEALQTKHGQLKTRGMTEDIEIDSGVTSKVMDAIEAFVIKKTHYPTNISDLPLDADILECVPTIEFEKMKKVVRARRKPGPKRGQKRKEMETA